MGERLKEINKRKEEIRSALQGDGEVDLDALKKELEKLDHEEMEIRSRAEIAKKINIGAISGTPIIKPEERKVEAHGLDSVEYRSAFMEFAKTGSMAEEFRAVAMTADNQAVIPITVMNKVIEKLEVYGNILPLVTRTNFPAGLSIPTSQITSMATWTTEGAEIPVEGKKTGSVTFAAYPLVKALGISFQASVQSLSAFEASIITGVTAAMAKGLEYAIISGTGVGQAKGIIKETPANTVSLADKLSFKDIVNIKKAIPAGYRAGAVLVMNDATFWEFYGMTDSNGQPIARVNFGVSGDADYMLFGNRVIATDWLPDISGASAGATVAFAMQMDKYVLNTAYNMDLVQYVEHATRNKVYQSFMLADGKMVDTNGLVFINKGTKA